MNDLIVKIAKILRTDQNVLSDLFSHMEEATNKKDIPQKVLDENNKSINFVLKELGLKNNAHQFEVYDALMQKIREDDKKLFEALNGPRCVSYDKCKSMLDFAVDLANVGKGMFLKKSKAEEFLRNQPPKKVISSLGYKDVNELLNNEDMTQVFASLRFIEDTKWLNNVFFAQYKDLKPEDFEIREIKLEVLDIKWLKAAEKFLKKKFHNVSHLKELGVIFVIPLELNVDGETMRLFNLLLHYLNEVSFYSKLFQNFSKDSESFSKNLISSLRGDVLSERISNNNKTNWMIVQRYLAKIDKYDWRLYFPHVNPEALHWGKAQQSISKINERIPTLNLKFWDNLDYVADFFKTKSGVENLVSMNLVDVVMSLVMEKDLIKYTYHHQEALWNKIFMEYIGSQDDMENILIDNFNKGYISF